MVKINSGLSEVDMVVDELASGLQQTLPKI